MRNSTLAHVRSMVKAETGKSLDALSTAQDAEINQRIWNLELELASSYVWPFLKSRWDSILSTGTRFQTYPTNLSPQGGAAATTAMIDFDRPVEMMVKWNAIWQSVVYGIDEYPEMNYLDPDRNQVLDPVQRWQMSDQTEFEVWPLPASAAQVRFIGNRIPVTLETGTTNPPTWNDAALVDFDDLLVSLLVAANYLAAEEKPNAKLIEGKAMRRLNALLSGNHQRTETITIGRGQTLGRKAIRQVPMVVIGGK